MKRYALVTVVLFAAILVIWLMMTRWEEQGTPRASDNPEREVLGLTATGAAVSGGADTPADTSLEDAEALAATGEAVSSGELTKKSREFTEYIIAGDAEKVLDGAAEVLTSKQNASDIELTFESMTSALGNYIGIESTNEGEDGSYRWVIVTLRYEGNDGATIKYVYDKAGKLSGIWFDTTKLAVAPDKGSRYDEKNIRVGRSPYVLDGKLTLPVETERKKPPVVILISQDADSDMDGTIGEAGNKPLRDIAHGLALRGVASIRFNRRRNQYPKTAGADAGIREYLLKDVWMAIDMAGYQAQIDSDAVYVLAIGEAAEYMPAIVDKRSRRVRGAIFVGAKPTSHTDIDYIDLSTKTESDAKYFMQKNMTMPLLFLQGDKDFETPVTQFEQWQTLLRGRAHTAFHLYKQLGHYLFTGGKEPSAEDYDRAELVNTGPITDIANWCMEQTKKGDTD